MTWNLEITSDKRAVYLDLREFGPDEQIDSEQLSESLTERGVFVDADLLKHIYQVVHQVNSSKIDSKEPVLAETIEPVTGEDANFEWSEKCNPDKRQGHRDGPGDGGRQSFYSQSSLIIVSKGDLLGVLHPATAGQAGRDIFGNSIAAESGKGLEIEAGENVEFRAEGNGFRALCDGKPQLEKSVLSIDPTVKVESDVDFGTGNISYGGDIEIKGDIKDLFEVSTGGDITVAGTVEAARIDCGGSLHVGRGIAGKEKGAITVQKDLSAKYLSNVSIWVHGKVTVESEIINADLNCGGDVVLQKGAIHGGQVTAAGSLHAHIIGSPLGVATVIRVGIDPFVEMRAALLMENKSELIEVINRLLPQAKSLLAANQGRPTDEVRDLAGKIDSYQKNIKQIEAELAELEKQNAERTNSVIMVEKRIYAGSIFHVGSVWEKVNRKIGGPIEVIVSPENASTLLLQYPQKR